jgi:hypothetical protein
MSPPTTQTCRDNARRKTAALARRWTGRFAQSFSLDFDKVALIVSPSTDQFLACAYAFGAVVSDDLGEFAEAQDHLSSLRQQNAAMPNRDAEPWRHTETF